MPVCWSPRDWILVRRTIPTISSSQALLKASRFRSACSSPPSSGCLFCASPGPPKSSRPCRNLLPKPEQYGLAVNYRGKEYVVADVDSESVNPADYALENETWNRDMFRLINQLSSQVTVDISKYPLQEILQLRTN